jgi:hypothetical protein
MEVNLSSQADTVRALQMLRSMDRDPRPLIPLDYKLYRKWYSKAQVPPQKTLGDQAGNILIVLVKKEDAITFLKGRFQFLRREEMVKELEDAGRDLCGNQSRE